MTRKGYWKPCFDPSIFTCVVWCRRCGRMDFDDVLHNLIAKAMLAKMYWETQEIDALESLLASFAAYLRRKRQVSDQQRAAYQNFVRFMRRLQALPPGKKAARTALKEEIANTALVAEKDWLIRML